jgi:hypothetical protein
MSPGFVTVAGVGRIEATSNAGSCAKENAVPNTTHTTRRSGRIRGQTPRKENRFP